MAKRTKAARPTTVYLTEAQKQALPRAAEKSGTTAAELIRRGVDLALAEPAKPLQAEQPTSTSVAPARPLLGEVGVSGTTIWSGQLQTEANSRLRDEQGYGSPGSIEWGEWEKLERTDHAVASALGLISAPLRDSTLEVEPGAVEKAMKSLAFNGYLPPRYLLSASVKPPEEPTEEEEPGSTPKPQTRNEVIAAFVKDCLQKWIAPGWSFLAEQISHYGLAYGFYLGEEVWGTRPDPRVPGGIAWYIRRLAQRLPSSVQSNGWIEENGELVTIRQAGVRDGKWHYGLELPASKCLLASWNRNGNNYRGFPAFRPVWYIGQQRADLLRILGIGSAREALGILSVETEKEVTLSKTQRDDIQEFIENAHAHESLAVQLPPGVKLVWLTSSGANKGHVLELWKALGLAVYETVQAQQTTLGTGETGSRSVGEVHDASRNAFVNGVRAWLESVLNGIGEQPYTGLVRKLVDVNFGPQAEYPRVRISLKKPEIAVDVFTAALKTAREAGAIELTAEDERDIRERLGLGQREVAEPKPDEAASNDVSQDSALNGAQVASLLEILRAISNGAIPRETGVRVIEASFPVDLAQAEVIVGELGRSFTPTPPSTPAPPDPGSGPPAPPDPEAAQRAAAKLSEQPTPFVPRRALRPAEQLLNLADIADYLDTGKDRFEAALRPIVEEMIRGAAGKVREAMADGDPSELSRLKLDTKLLVKAVELYVENARAFGYRQARLELEKQGVRTLAEQPASSRMTEQVTRLLLVDWDPWTGDVTSRVDWTKDEKGVRGVVKVDFVPGKLSDEDVENIVRAQAKMVTERIGGRLKQQVWDAAVDSVRRGQSADDAVRAVLADLEASKALRGDAELILSRSFGLGREQLFQENADAISALEYSAVLDRATCEPCDAEDGKTFTVNSAEHIAHLTPYAGCKGNKRCRCVLIPIAAQAAA